MTPERGKRFAFLLRKLGRTSTNGRITAWQQWPRKLRHEWTVLAKEYEAAYVASMNMPYINPIPAEHIPLVFPDKSMIIGEQIELNEGVIGECDHMSLSAALGGPQCDCHKQHDHA